MSAGLEGFPWSQTKGLCKVLRNANLWSSIFTGEDRHEVKRAAKKAASTRNSFYLKGLSVTDDDAVGGVVVELLVSPSGRRELAREFDNLNSFIARGLYDRQLNDHKDRIPRFDELFERDTGQGWHFLPAKLAAWYARREVTPEDQRTLSLYACYLALQEPRQAKAILEAFICLDDAFLDWLSDEEATPKPPLGPPPQLLPEPAKIDAQPEPQDAMPVAIVPKVVPNDESLPSRMTVLPSDSAELVRLLTLSGDWDRDLSLEQLGVAVDLLRRKAERHANRLQDVDETRRRIHNHLEEVAQLPWLECPLSIDQFLLVPLDISVEGALEHFAVVERAANRFLQLHKQLEMLVAQLGCQPFPCVPHEVTSLKEIEACLEDHVASLAKELEAISLREENVVEFFDRFVALDQWDGLQLLETTEPTLWVDIVRFMLASGPLTDAGKRYKQLR